VTIPSYGQLPQLGDLGVRHARGILPAARGTLSFIDAAAVAAAAQLVVDGVTIPLNLAIDAFDPPLFGRSPLLHHVVEASRNDAEDILDSFNPQASSQLDGLAHVRAREHGYFDGSLELEDARAALGMHHWARSGIAGRGILLDAQVALGTDFADPLDGAGISPDDLERIAQLQGVALRPGDILLIRTGWAPTYLALSADDKSKVTGWSGLEATEAMAQFLWDHRISLVGSDNPAVENGPGSRDIGSLHRRLLPTLGMPLMELLDLERLADHCRGAQNWEFMFVSVPLHLRGGVSSPANAMALL
jgi:kynurenine formamidase